MATEPGLREALLSWAELPHLGRYGTSPRKTLAAAHAAMRQFNTFEPREPEAYDLTRLLERARAAVASGGIGTLRPQDLRRLPWVLFYPDDTDARHWLGADDTLLRDYRRWLGKQRRTSSLVSLIHELLRVYPVTLPTFEKWLRLVRTQVNDSKASSVQQLAPTLFQSDGDRDTVAKMIASRDSDVTSLGLSPGLARCAFLKSGVRRCLDDISPRIRTATVDISDIEGVFKLLELDNDLRFKSSDMYRDIARALLLPLAGHQARRSALMEPVCSWFVRLFGDPRMAAHGFKWRRVPNEARMVVERWLVRGTFEQFFRLIRDTAYDRHWRYRQRFWKAYLRRDMIDATWFVLGRRAGRLLRQITDNKVGRSGRLYGGTSDQSVLLMRIAGATVAEWSHNGACRIWRDTNRRAPTLYLDEYDRDKLASHSADFRQPHHGSATGRWQFSVAECIREYTGRAVTRREYMYDADEA